MRGNAELIGTSSAAAPTSTAPAISEGDRVNPAKTFPGSDPNAAKTFAGSRRFTAAAYHDTICEKLDAQLSIQRIWQDLVEDFGYGASYESIKRYIRTLPTTRRAVGVFVCCPGEEGQVDFFRCAPTLDVTTGQWKRPWVFRLTLSHSRHGYEEAVWDQLYSARTYPVIGSSQFVMKTTENWSGSDAMSVAEAGGLPTVAPPALPARDSQDRRLRGGDRDCHEAPTRSESFADGAHRAESDGQDIRDARCRSIAHSTRSPAAYRAASSAREHSWTARRGQPPVRIWRRDHGPRTGTVPRRSRNF
jgi:hypothetical protein